MRVPWRCGNHWSFFNSDVIWPFHISHIWLDVCNINFSVLVHTSHSWYSGGTLETWRIPIWHVWVMRFVGPHTRVFRGLPLHLILYLILSAAQMLSAIQINVFSIINKTKQSRKKFQCLCILKNNREGEHNLFPYFKMIHTTEFL